MNIEFYKQLMDKTGFPEEARQALARSAEALLQINGGADIPGAVEFFYENNLDIKLVTPFIEGIAENSGEHVYTVWLIFLMEASAPAKEAYLQQGVSEDIFWATFGDLKFKAIECYNNYGVWGTFVAFWYPIFFTCDIFKLGRMEFENCVFEEEKPYRLGEYTVNPGDKVKSVHIPSSGEPFDPASRLDSYKQAYEFFKEELNGKPLVCVCYSWLLYPEYEDLLPPTSNIAGFRKDFTLIRGVEEKEFGDCWRIFGPDSKKPVGELPETTSMQRSFKTHLLAGGKVGEGVGIMLFDGKKIIKA